MYRAAAGRVWQCDVSRGRSVYLKLSAGEDRMWGHSLKSFWVSRSFSIQQKSSKWLTLKPQTAARQILWRAGQVLISWSEIFRAFASPIYEKYTIRETRLYLKVWQLLCNNHQETISTNDLNAQALHALRHIVTVIVRDAAFNCDSYCAVAHLRAPVCHRLLSPMCLSAGGKCAVAAASKRQWTRWTL